MERPPVAMTRDRAENTPRSVFKWKPSWWPTSRTGVADLDGDAGLSALLFQHGNNVAGRPVAKELSQRLLVPGDVVFFYQLQEIRRGVAGQRGLGEVRVRGEEVFRRGVQVGEVAAAPTRDQDLFANASWHVPATEHDGRRGLHAWRRKAGGPGSHDEHVIVGRHSGCGLSATFLRQTKLRTPGALAGWPGKRGRA